MTISIDIEYLSSKKTIYASKTMLETVVCKKVRSDRRRSSFCFIRLAIFRPKVTNLTHETSSNNSRGNEVAGIRSKGSEATSKPAPTYAKILIITLFLG
jgi:hypothetical protein